MDVSYDALLRRLAVHYLANPAPEGGGWAMRRGERPLRGSILGTAYALSILRYAGYQPAQPEIRAGLLFLAIQASEDKRRPQTEWAVRHAVHTILGLTEWSTQRIRESLGETPDAVALAKSVEEATDYSVDWLRTHRRADSAWSAEPSPGSTATESETGESPHLCIAWTASVLYALSRLRERGRSELDLIEESRQWVIDQALAGDAVGAWPICGRSEPGIANTALAVIALSHRHALTGSSADSQAQMAAEAGRDWLLAHVAEWRDNEAGEDDPAADDGWQHVVWSLAPRACLSAGAPPHQPELRHPLRFAFERWGDRPYPGWFIRGVGKTGYSNWSVVQLGQVLKLAISRQDPLYVLDALADKLNQAGDPLIDIRLEEQTHTALVKAPNAAIERLPLANHPKQWALLLAFAREHPAHDLSHDAIDATLNSPPKGDQSWGAVRGLVHSLNQHIRDALNDKDVTVLSCTAKRGRRVTITATCRLVGHAPELDDPNL